MTLPTARQAFAAALEERKAERQRPFDFAKTLQMECNNALLDAAAQQHPSKAKRLKGDSGKAWKLLGEEAAKLVEAPFRVRADAVWEDSKTKTKALTERLFALAEVSDIEAGDSWLFYDMCRGSDYNSQGLGADSYARASAEVRADQPRGCGVETVVVYDEGHRSARTNGESFRYGSGYVVAVKVASDLDVEIIKCKPGQNIKEWLRAVLKRAANPWVLSPMLPRDIMEVLGLDWHGNDVTPIPRRKS